MLTDFICSLIIGSVLGILSGLGTGGGSILILWLTLVKNVSPEDARILNLMFYLPAAIVACCFRWKQGTLDLKKVLPAMIAGSITAGIFTWYANLWNAEILRKLFGVLLLFTGTRELLYRPKENS